MPSKFLGPMTRRRLMLGAAPLLAVPLVGCESGHSTHTGIGDLFSNPVPNAPPPAAQPLPTSGDVIGTGSVKVALILPKSAGGQSGAIADQLRNAAALALRNYTGANLQLVVKDDAGTTDRVVDSVGQAHPGLVGAVVVRAPQEELGRLAGDGDGLVQRRRHARLPSQYKRVFGQFSGDGCGLAVAGVDDRVRRQRKQEVN